MVSGGLVRQGEISFTTILSLHIHSMRYIKEWTAKKNPDPGDIPVIQSSPFQRSVWGGGRRNHTEPRKQGKIQSNIRGGENTMTCSCRCSGSTGGFWASLWSLTMLRIYYSLIYVGGGASSGNRRLSCCT